MAILDVEELQDKIETWVRTGKNVPPKRELELMQRNLVLTARDATDAAAKLYTLLRGA